MINSLFKDSHIARKIAHAQPTCKQERGVGKREKNSSLIAPKNNCTKKPAEISFSGFSNAKGKSFFTNKYFKDFLLMATDNQAVFGAFYALGLTCIFRPAAIMALPTNKKNVDDKKYAAAHSIASGVIAFGLAFVISNPISMAIKKVIENPALYIKNKESEFLKNPKLLEGAKKYINMLPDAIIAAPRAIITIALIPPILKYVFGWEKKSKIKEKSIGTEFSENYAAVNFRSSNFPQKKVFQNFSGGRK